MDRCITRVKTLRVGHGKWKPGAAAEDERLLAGHMVEIAWQELLEVFGMAPFLHGADHRVLFLRGYTGNVRLLRIGPETPKIRVGMGPHDVWNWGS